MSFENLDGKGVALPYTQSLAGWQFISSATTKAFTVEMYDFTGAMVGEFTTASPTVAGFASTLSWTETTGGAAVAWNPLWAGFVVKTTVATSYAKDASGHVPVTAVNGTALAIGMPIGVVPQRLYDAYYGGSASNTILALIQGSNDGTKALYNGALYTVNKAVIAASTSGNNTIVAADATRKIVVLRYSIMCNAAVNFKWQSGAGGTDLTGLYYNTANTGLVESYNNIALFETTATNTLLNLNLSGAVAVGGAVWYILV